MFQNVEYTGRILRQGLKRDAERLVHLAVIHPNQLCAGLFVVHFHHLSVQLFAFTHTVNAKAVTRRSFVQIHHGDSFPCDPRRVIHFLYHSTTGS